MTPRRTPWFWLPVLIAAVSAAFVLPAFRTPHDVVTAGSPSYLEGGR